MIPNNKIKIPVNAPSSHYQQIPAFIISISGFIFALLYRGNDSARFLAICICVGLGLFIYQGIFGLKYKIFYPRFSYKYRGVVVGNDAKIVSIVFIIIGAVVIIGGYIASLYFSR